MAVRCCRCREGRSQLQLQELPQINTLITPRTDHQHEHATSNNTRNTSSNSSLETRQQRAIKTGAACNIIESNLRQRSDSSPIPPPCTPLPAAAAQCQRRFPQLSVGINITIDCHCLPQNVHTCCLSLQLALPTPLPYPPQQVRGYFVGLCEANGSRLVPPSPQLISCSSSSST